MVIASSHEIALCMIFFIVVFLSAMMVFIRRLVRVPPNMALVVYGAGRGRQRVMVDGKPKDVHSLDVVVGGTRWVPPVVADYAMLPTNVMTVEVLVKDVVSKDKRGFDAGLVAQAQILPMPNRFWLAAECLLGHDDKTLEAIARDAIAGAVRVVMGRMTLAEINADRSAAMVEAQRVADTTLAEVGLGLRSLVMKELSGKDLEMVGWPRTNEAMVDFLERKVARLEEATVSAPRAG